MYRRIDTLPVDVVWPEVSLFSVESTTDCWSLIRKMSDGGGGDDSSGTMEVSAAVQTVADAAVLQKHIHKLVPLFLEDGGEAPTSLETAVEEKRSIE